MGDGPKSKGLTRISLLQEPHGELQFHSNYF